MAVGRLIWRALASNLGVLPVPGVTAWQIVMVAAGTILAAKRASDRPGRGRLTNTPSQ